MREFGRHHLAELIGVTLVLAGKLQMMLYMPLLEHTLTHRKAVISSVAVTSRPDCKTKLRGLCNGCSCSDGRGGELW
jgi:hypothetical protein